MKKLLLLFVSFSFYSCGTTPIVVNTEPFTETFVIDGDKDVLYVKANNWMVENFNDAKSVIQFSDKESGTVTGKYRVGEVPSVATGSPLKDIFAIVRLQVKDNASKITITADNYSYTTYRYKDASGAQKLSEENLTLKMELLISSFEDYMKNSDSHLF